MCSSPTKRTSSRAAEAIDPRRSAPIHGCPESLSTHIAAEGARRLRVRAGRPDSGAGTGAGFDVAAPGEELPRRRSGASLLRPWRRGGHAPWSVAQGRHIKRLLEFIRDRGPVHPRQVDDHFSLGTVTNYWGGSSSATTHLLDAMHYRGLLRVVRREAGIRVYGVHEHAPGPLDARERRVRLD